MGKVLKVVAIVVAVAVIIFAPQIAAFVAATLAISSAIATAVIAAALTVGASVALKSLTARRPSALGDGTPSVFRQSIANSFIVYGRRRVGGMMVFFHPRKVGKDHYRYFVIAVAGHHCQGNPTWMLGDSEVTVDGSNKVTSGPYANAAWLWLQLGEESETANATFVSECGGKWTSAHKGNGICAIYAKFKMTDEVVNAGMPNITAMIDGKDDIFDPRDDSTGYSNNAQLVFEDWMQLPREEGGFGAYPDEQADEDWISAQANVCDEEVEGEARYAVDAVITTGSAPSEIRDAFIMSCAGSYTFTEGRHKMRPGYWVPPSASLSESDLAAGIQVSPFLAGDQSANEVQGTYISPDDRYQGMPFGTQTLDPAPTDIRQMDLDQPFITSKYRAERIARIMLMRAFYEKTVTWPMNIVGLKVSALDTVQLDTARYGLSNYAWVVTNWGISQDFSVVLNLREENEDIYADPSPVTPDSVPAIDVADPVMLTSELSVLIANSFTSPTQILSATETGGVASIEIIPHDRVYPDGVTVSLTGDTIGSLLTDTPYYLYYDDLDRSDTAPPIVATTDPNEAQSGVDRHALGRIRTPVTASGIEYVGGGVLPTGAQLGVVLE